MTVMLRQKMEPISLCSVCSVYLFQHPLTFTCFKHFYFRECIACYDETVKIKVFVVM